MVAYFLYDGLVVLQHIVQNSINTTRANYIDVLNHAIFSPYLKEPSNFYIYKTLLAFDAV